MKNICKKAISLCLTVYTKTFELLLFVFAAVVCTMAKCLFCGGDYIYYDILSDRAAEIFSVDGADESITNAVLDIICAAFDIDPADKYKIRPSDSVMAIYDSWYENSIVDMDDCELERFCTMLSILVSQKVQHDILKKSVGEIIAFAAKNRANKEVTSSELENILNFNFPS